MDFHCFCFWIFTLDSRSRNTGHTHQTVAGSYKLVNGELWGPSLWKVLIVCVCVCHVWVRFCESGGGIHCWSTEINFSVTNIFIWMAQGTGGAHTHTHVCTATTDSWDNLFPNDVWIIWHTAATAADATAADIINAVRLSSVERAHRP